MRLQIKLRKLHSEKGEISIYLSLVFTLLISLLLTIITGARGAALQAVYECAVESALLSVFGEYNRELLERYDVFFIDLSYLSNSPDPGNLETRLNEYFNDNFHPENGTSLIFYSDLLDVTDTNVSLTGYELATDRYGEPFRNQVCDYMSNLVGADELKNMTDMITLWDSYNLNSEGFHKIRDDVKDDFITSDEDTWEQTVLKNKITSMLYFDENALVLMGADYFKLSLAGISISDTLFLRAKEKGTEKMSESRFEPAENLYFTEYIMQKMSNYMDQREDTKLKYEAEYILFGQGYDRMNMQCMVQGLFCIRALEDYISLNLASDKVDEVRSVSEIIEAIIEIPEPVITQAILIGWAALESMTDVSKLIDGEKVEFIKASDQINVSVDGLINNLLEKAETEETQVSAGDNPVPDIKLGYTDYLRILLYILPSQIKTYRTMDLIEVNLRESGTGNEFFRFDACTDRVKAVFTVETGFDFRFLGEKRYSYF